MLLRRPRPAQVALCLLLLVGLIASSCGSAGDDDPEVAAQPDLSGLLPPADQTNGAETSSEPEPTMAAGSVEQPTPAAQVLPTPTPDVLSCLSQRAQVAQLLLPLATQAELPGAQVFAADGELGGIGLLGAPDSGIAEVIQGIQNASFVPLLVASDEEGGAVQRLGDLLGPIPSAAATAQSKSPEEVRKQWVEYGSRVRALGIDVVFGPVLDVGSAPGIESRSFGDDPATVAAYGRAVAEGLLEADVLPVFKHFPGHGRASADSHLELPTTPPIAELRELDLVPYVELFADPTLGSQSAVMIAHLAVPGLSEQVPTSLSPETITGLLRTELGFGGLVFTDALNMGAIVNTYGRVEALELALVAGADIAILGSLADLTPALDHLEMRVAEDPVFRAIVQNRAQRVLAAKGQSALCLGAQ